MLRLGLTGGIASGKSTVGATLRKLGFTVLDADSIAHQLIEQGQPAYDEVVSEFGDSILNADQRISRAALAKIVFADSHKLERLNAIIHPRVEERLLVEFDKLQRDNSRRVAFVEAALIIEAGLHRKLDGVVVVWCKPAQQLQRLLARGLSEEEARRRIASQLSLEEKLLHATEKIDCSGSLAETHRQVEELATNLRGARPTE
jgi:dephospho-CoA kinase